jgi:hypothetical protein
MECVSYFLAFTFSSHCWHQLMTGDFLCDFSKRLCDSKLALTSSVNANSRSRSLSSLSSRYLTMLYAQNPLTEIIIPMMLISVTGV